MNVKAFYNTLARVLSERTDTEIKVKEITENGNGYGYGTNNSGRIQRTCA